MFKNISIGTKATMIFSILFVSFIFVGIYIYLQLNQTIAPLNKDVPKTIQELTLNSRLDSTAQFIRYYDEVLTQAARNYAFTEDPKWKNIYDEAVPKLDEYIKSAIQLGDAQDKQIFSSIDSANLALVDMETESLKLVSEKKSKEAVKILESPEYWNQKEIYKNGLVEYSAKRGKQYDEALSASSVNFERINVFLQTALQNIQYIIIFSGAGMIFIMLLLRYIISTVVIKPIKKISDYAQSVSKGEQTTVMFTDSNDEIGRLTKSLNIMISEITQAKENIEKKVQQRTSDLERLNKTMIGRELKMIELKKQIEELQQKLKQYQDETPN